MPTLATSVTWVIGLLACAGEPVAPPPPPILAAPPQPAPAADAEAPQRPPLQCADGAVPKSGENTEGQEQWCDLNGVMHGPYRRYYENGKKAVDGAYIENRPDGIWLWWHESGEKSSKGTYKMGKQAGSWTWWHPNGQLAQEGDFLVGRKSGKWTTWYPDGTKSEEGLYHNGNKTGDWVYFRNRTGSVERREVWRRGVLVETRGEGQAPPPE